MIQHLTILRQFVAYNGSKNNSDQNVIRDKSMAENVQWILDYEANDSKMALWAHNGHIQKRHSEYGANMMGYHLSQKLGDEFYAIGFDFNKGGFQAINKGLEAHWVEDAKPNSTSYIFSKCQPEMFFLDFDLASENADMKDFLNDKLQSRSIGAIFKPNKVHSYYMVGPLIDLYDGLIFINETSRAEPLKRFHGAVIKFVDAADYRGQLVKLSAMVKSDSLHHRYIMDYGQDQKWGAI